MRRGDTYKRRGKTRKITGVQRVGKGQGLVAEVGRVWWTEPRSSKEHYASIADFQQWLRGEA